MIHIDNKLPPAVCTTFVWRLFLTSHHLSVSSQFNIQQVWEMAALNNSRQYFEVCTVTPQPYWLTALWEILDSSSQPPTISTSQSYAPPLSLPSVLVVTLYCQHSSVRPVVLLLPSLAGDHSQDRVFQHLLSFLQFTHHLWLSLIIVDLFRIIVVIFTYKSAMCGLRCGGE